MYFYPFIILLETDKYALKTSRFYQNTISVNTNVIYYDRSQYVAFDETHSSTQPIKCGIPQGSILGPLLLIIYMNDICNVSEMLFYILYADDTTVIIKDKDISILLQTLNVELEKLSIWLKANKLSLTAKKAYYLFFHRAGIKINI